MPSVAGKEVGPTGYGLMGMTWRKEPPSQEMCFETLNTALELGANFWNGGELYGTPEYNSLHLLKKYFTEYPENAEKVVLSIKGGLRKGELTVDGSEANIRRSVDECLRLLGGTKKIDIFECAAQDTKFSIEHTMEILKTYVDEEKIGNIGLSNVDAETIRRAHKVYPKIAAVELELSMWTQDILKNECAQTCAELGIPVIAYSPLGRGVFAGALNSLTDIPEGDPRRRMPRFEEENFQRNTALINEVKKLADEQGLAPAQLALAWVHSQSLKTGMPTFIPIPGGTTEEKLRENMAAPESLEDSVLDKIATILRDNPVAGDAWYTRH